METLNGTVVELCEAVWSQTLDLPLEHVRDLSDHPSDSWIRGQVRIMGAWTGAVVLDCSAAFAAEAAGRVFAGSSRPPSAEDLRDTIGELTNIIGGNLKGIVSDAGSHLSLPVVSEGANIPPFVPGTRIVTREAFLCRRAPLVVTVLQADGEPGATA